METDNLKLLELIVPTSVSLTSMINSSKEVSDKIIVNTFNTLVEIGKQRNEQQTSAILVIGVECIRRFSYDPLYSRLHYKLDNFEKIELVGKVIRPQGQRAPNE